MAVSLEQTFEINVHDAASLIINAMEDVLIIDCRPFTEYNTLHIKSALSISNSKVLRRRLVENKISMKDLLLNSHNCDVDKKGYVILYDAEYHSSGSSDSFIFILFNKLRLFCKRVNLLADSFEEFRKHYPELCEDKLIDYPINALAAKPCLPSANQCPSGILPFLYLGAHRDALNQELLKAFDINYVMNVTTDCSQPNFIPEGHFTRIPINDTCDDKILPHLPQAFQFLDKVKEAKSRVLVHCYAGISRSATIAIAYVMYHLHMSLDESFRYVKSKRPVISPNFNFLGQLLEFEKQLGLKGIAKAKDEAQSEVKEFGVGGGKRLCRRGRSSSLSEQDVESICRILQAENEDDPPMSAFANLSLDTLSLPERKPPNASKKLKRSKSCD